MKQSTDTARCHPRKSGDPGLTAGYWIPDQVGNDRTKRGFIAAEMFMVVALALVIFVGTVYYFLYGSSYSRDDRRLSDLRQLSNALSLAYDAEGVYPKGCEWSTEACWKDFLSAYFKRTPKDPINTEHGNCAKEPGCFVYRYCRLDDGSAYIISINLENPRRRPLGNNNHCSLGGPNQHWVTN